jgi:hypothetical protein
MEFIFIQKFSICGKLFAENINEMKKVILFQTIDFFVILA